MGKVKSRLHATAFLAAISASLLLGACRSGDLENEKEAKQDTEAAAQGAEHKDGFASYADDAAISEEMLQRAVAPFFEDSALDETRAVVIMHGGLVIAERYAPGISPETPLLGWSMSKTLTATLLGIMVADGRLSLDSPAPVAEWQTPGDPRAKITLRQLLHMASGLDHTEGPTEENGKAIYEADTARMLFLEDGRDDSARYAETRILEAAPGTQFEYSTATSNILSDIMTRILTDSKNADVRQAAMLQFAKGRLFEPLEMDSMVPEFDRSGTMLGGAMIHGTARDWGKLAEFLRNNGSVKGAQLLPTRWVRFMLTPSEQDEAYGGHIWLNRVRRAGRNQVLFPGKAPDDVFAMLGHLGQFAVVSPKHKLVIVRMGKTTDDRQGPVNDQIAQVINLFLENKKK